MLSSVPLAVPLRAAGEIQRHGKNLYVTRIYTSVPLVPLIS